MKILYAAGLSPKESSLYRLWALERLGHQVIPFNTFDYLPRNPLVSKVAHRLSAGPSVNRLNRDLLRDRSKPRGPICFGPTNSCPCAPRPSTAFASMGIATVSYMIDNPFGTRRDSGWRLYMKNIPHYDLHVVQRDKNILDYTPTWSARRHQDPDRIRADTALSPARRLVRRRPRPPGLLHRHAL